MYNSLVATVSMPFNARADQPVAFSKNEDLAEVKPNELDEENRKAAMKVCCWCTVVQCCVMPSIYLPSLLMPQYANISSVYTIYVLMFPVLRLYQSYLVCTVGVE